MPVMDQKVSPKCTSAIVVHAAGAISHISHHDCVYVGKPATPVAYFERTLTVKSDRRCILSKIVICSFFPYAHNAGNARFEYVDQRASIEQQTLGELKRDYLALRCTQAPNGLVDLMGKLMSELMIQAQQN